MASRKVNNEREIKKRTSERQKKEKWTFIADLYILFSLPLPTVAFEKFKIGDPVLCFCQEIGVLVGTGVGPWPHSAWHILSFFQSITRGTVYVQAPHYHTSTHVSRPPQNLIFHCKRAIDCLAYCTQEGRCSHHRPTHVMSIATQLQYTQIKEKLQNCVIDFRLNYCVHKDKVCARYE